jgi:4'-phosphopantetheinyl transferase
VIPASGAAAGGGVTPDGITWRWREYTADDLAPAGRWQERLAPEELAHARSLERPAVRAAFVAGRDLLRALVSEWTGAPPAQVAVTRSAFGAPTLPDHPGAGCSISHSVKAAVVALRPAGAVGVDLEPHDRPFTDLPALLPLACSEAERAGLDGLDADILRVRFLTLWTAKEAALKALGLGLQVDPRTVHVEFACDAETGSVHAAGQRWHLRRLPTVTAHLAVLAIPHDTTPVTVAP